MGNRKAREFFLAQHEAADWRKLRTESRMATSDVVARGFGARRLQLIVCPSFSKSMAWEVRQRQEDWGLFRAEGIAPWPSIQLIGYDPVPIKPAVLSSFFARIIGLSLPISPDLSGMGGADGTVSQLAVFGDMWSEWRFQWWSQPPTQWQPLVDIAAEMVRAFEEVQGRPSTQF
jgi:hypothetical protein